MYYKKLLSLVEKYRLKQKIKFFSFCKEMPVAYKLANVVVSASIEPEAFGRVSIEAQWSYSLDFHKLESLGAIQTDF